MVEYLYRAAIASVNLIATDLSLLEIREDLTNEI